MQRKRAAGWKKPTGVKSVTRPGPWGNPYKTAAEFREALTMLIESPPPLEVWSSDPQLKHMMNIRDRLEELRGKDLMCWCALDKDCHADVLLEFANRKFV